MITALIATSNGIIVLDEGTKPKINSSKKDTELLIVDYGLVVILQDIRIFIPEIYLDHLIKTGIIAVYHKEMRDYAAELLFVLELPKQSIAEAKGAYLFKKKNTEKETEKEPQVAEPVSAVTG